MGPDARPHRVQACARAVALRLDTARDLDREYREMRRQWLDQRETIEQAYNERIEACQTAQDDLRFAFDAANEIQAQKNAPITKRWSELRTGRAKARSSARSRGSEQSVTQEFQRHSRESGPERGL